VNARSAREELPSATPGWQAGLELCFEGRPGRTVLARSAHHGPLRVQRPFYPEADGACHVYLLHPPGGVVGGDVLDVRVRGHESGRALLTTPGATKLYRSAGAEAQLRQTFEVGTGFCLEWLPQETIAFSGTRARIRTHVKLAAGASYAGWEIFCLGRPAAGERFSSGSLRIESKIEREGQLQWLERGLFLGGERALTAAWGLGGHAVVGTFVIAPASAPEEGWLEALRAATTHGDQPLFAATLVSGLVVVRYVGAHVHQATKLFRETWRVLRPYYAGACAVMPRIWQT
jgi:urease accessory protein